MADVAESFRLELVLRQIKFAREYTCTLLDGLSHDDWFTMPGGAPSHIAWQVGHLAMAEYGLCLFRMRGRRTEDLSLMSSTFRKQYSRGTAAEPDPSRQPTPTELRGVLDRVHQQALQELPSFTDELLDESVDMPYAAYATKYGALLFCSHHEMIHAGQIGMIRRLLGRPPVR